MAFLIQVFSDRFTKKKTSCCSDQEANPPSSFWDEMWCDQNAIFFSLETKSEKKNFQHFLTSFSPPEILSFVTRTICSPKIHCITRSKCHRRGQTLVLRGRSRLYSLEKLHSVSFYGLLSRHAITFLSNTVGQISISISKQMSHCSNWLVDTN
jgi:hypothetical protein